MLQAEPEVTPARLQAWTFVPLMVRSLRPQGGWRTSILPGPLAPPPHPAFPPQGNPRTGCPWDAGPRLFPPARVCLHLPTVQLRPPRPPRVPDARALPPLEGSASRKSPRGARIKGSGPAGPRPPAPAFSGAAGVGSGPPRDRRAQGHLPAAAPGGLVSRLRVRPGLGSGGTPSPGQHHGWGRGLSPKGWAGRGGAGEEPRF